MIEVQHLTKRYGRITAVDDISFRVERGEILGFLGPNGAGKTTTMRILTGYMPATEGKAIVAGFDVFDQPIEAKRRTGYLPETPPLYPDMSVSEYLDFVAKIKGVPSADRATRIKYVMERTRITDMAHRLCGKLSKGYKQRVGLASALVCMVDRQLGVDTRACVGRALDDQAGADVFGALAHARHAECRGRARGRGVEAHAVVDRGDAEGFCAEV